MRSLIASVVAFVAMALPNAQDAHRFEVASVRRNTSGEQAFTFNTQFDRFTATNVTVHDIVRIAYAVQPFQLLDEPDWFRSERYDIVAKAAGSPSREDLRLMLRDLLADRFALRVGTETRQLPLYEMRIASSDGRLGPQLRPVDLDCDPRAIDARRAAKGRLDPRPPGQRPECGTSWGAGRLSAGGVSMTQFAEVLSGFVERVVVDRTGLAGYFEFDLQYAPGQTQAPSDDPSLFTALQEQLGLRLQASRGAVNVIAIESAERPAAN
jgi:uncharacterized protein (TIGR03435 family)